MPTLGPGAFGRYTPREIEQHITGGILRLGQAWDLAAFVAASIMNSFSSFGGAPMTARRLLGRAPIPLDPRRPRPDVEDETGPTRDQERLWDRAGYPAGQLTDDEMDAMHAELEAAEAAYREKYPGRMPD